MGWCLGESSVVETTAVSPMSKDNTVNLNWQNALWWRDAFAIVSWESSAEFNRKLQPFVQYYFFFLTGSSKWNGNSVSTAKLDIKLKHHPKSPYVLLDRGLWADSTLAWWDWHELHHLGTFAREIPWGTPKGCVIQRSPPWSGLCWSQGATNLT